MMIILDDGGGGCGDGHHDEESFLAGICAFFVLREKLRRWRKK